MSGDRSRARVARRLAAGQRTGDIAAELGLAKATVGFHAARLGATHAGVYAGRRAVIEILARSGVRASELCDLRVRDVRLHDPDGARFRLRDAKTEAGVREVQMTPDLLEAFVEHLDRLHRIGRKAGPDDYAVPNQQGGRMSRQRVAEDRRRGRCSGERARRRTRHCRRSRTSHRTVCDAHTSRSLCWRTTSMSSG